MDLTQQFSQLPAGIPAWLASAGGGTVTRLERHIARREAWLVDITRPDGSVVEGFFRLERAPWPGNPWSLAKEAGVVSALASTSVPVPRVLASSDELHCALFERVRGRADLPAMPEAQRRAVLEDFFDILADLHKLDPTQLELPPMACYPKTARDAALSELDIVKGLFKDFLATHCDPLISYGIDWLERFAPKRVEKIALLQGDTGPVNFMFDGARVSAVIDWEWAHLGDPMEDLGNVCVRSFWNPSGEFDGLFERYQQRSGIPVDLDAVRYYRVQQNMRGMIPVAMQTLQANPQEPLAWHLAYRYVGDRSTVEALVEAMGMQVPQPEFPADAGDGDIMADTIAWSLQNDIAPALDPANAFATSRLRDAEILVRCLDRLRRFSAKIDAIERGELGALLGRSPATTAEGLRELDAAIRARRLGDDKVLPYLTRRTYRSEWLYAPVAQLYPDRRWHALRMQ